MYQPYFFFLFVKKRFSRSENDVRPKIWKTAYDIIKENPVWGVGAGDVNDKMLEGFKKADYPKLSNKHYNPHNLIIQAQLSNGIWGLLALVTIFGIILWYGNSSLVVLAFLSLVFISGLTESIFNRGSGAMFFVFLLVCLW